MIGRIFYGACAVGLVAATAVMAEPSNSTSTKNDPNRQICRTTPDSGTRLGRVRECHTAQEWDEIRRQTGDQIEERHERH